MSLRSRAHLCLLVLLMMAASVAHAASCNVAATSVSFGTYDPISANPTNSTGRITVSCNGNSGHGPYSLALSAGGGGSYAGRIMRSGSATIAYQLYIDAAHTRIWGDGNGGSDTVAGNDIVPKQSGNASFTVFGSIPARLITNPGYYSDVIIVTANY